ncbi:hypothetical protein K1719_037255 [Acacia pycnantha]|nr:hypothetical protein K1719_037255 [Acacia pycnantha]
MVIPSSSSVLPQLSLSSGSVLPVAAGIEWRMGNEMEYMARSTVSPLVSHASGSSSTTLGLLTSNHPQSSGILSYGSSFRTVSLQVWVLFVDFGTSLFIGILGTPLTQKSMVASFCLTPELVSAYRNKESCMSGQCEMEKEHANGSATRRSADDVNLFLVNDFQDPLQETLSSLELPKVIPLAYGPSNILVDESTLVENQGSGVNDGSSSAFHHQRRPRNKVHDPARDLSIQVLEKFSRVTNFARGTTTQLFNEHHSNGYDPNYRRNQYPYSCTPWSS